MEHTAQRQRKKCCVPVQYIKHLFIRKKAFRCEQIRFLLHNGVLVEQRDIMECCDSTGNTDPAAWRSTVNEAEYTPAERDALLAEAQATVSKQANAFSGKHEPTMEDVRQKGVEEATRLPYAAQPLDAYYHGIEDDLAALVRSTE